MASDADLLLLAELQELVQNAALEIDEAVEQKKNFIFSTHARQKQELGEARETKKVLQQRLVDVSELQKSNAKISQKQAEELSSIQGELAGVRNAENAGVGAKARLEAELAALNKERQALEEALVDKGRGVADRKKEMTRGVALYRERLGLEFERVDEDVLRFVFTRIDPDNWARPFSCSIFVDKDNRYQVPACDPPVKHDDLLRTLHETNNFSAFMCALRRRFQEHCARS